MNEIDKWPVSVLDRQILLTAIDEFLRTRHDGMRLLLDFLRSVPPAPTIAARKVTPSVVR